MALAIPTLEKTIPLKVYDNKPLVWLSTVDKSNKKEERIII